MKLVNPVFPWLTIRVVDFPLALLYFIHKEKKIVSVI